MVELPLDSGRACTGSIARTALSSDMYSARCAWGALTRRVDDRVMRAAPAGCRAKRYAPSSAATRCTTRSVPELDAMGVPRVPQDYALRDCRIGQRNGEQHREHHRLSAPVVTSTGRPRRPASSGRSRARRPDP